jgi:probable HAF family extracellular repeat protein
VTVTDLGTLGGAYSQATAVNASGQVVGDSYIIQGNSAVHPFSWTQKGGMVDLGTLPDSSRSFAMAVNDSGQVVGFTADASHHALVGAVRPDRVREVRDRLGRHWDAGEHHSARRYALRSRVAECSSRRPLLVGEAITPAESCAALIRNRATAGYRCSSRLSK